MWWYFFTEIFDHFRIFFRGVFQVHLREVPLTVAPPIHLHCTAVFAVQRASPGRSLVIKRDFYVEELSDIGGYGSVGWAACLLPRVH